jgi:hypothetical protein
LTDKGLQVLQESMRSRQNWLYNLAAALSDSEKETITAAMNVLIDRTQRSGHPIEPDR